MKFHRLTLTDAAAQLRHMVGVGKWDTSGGLATIEQVIGNGAAFMAERNEKPALLFAIEKGELGDGLELRLRVAYQLDTAGDLTETAVPEIIDAFGHDCQSVRIETKRPGLMAKLERLGFSECARVYRKKL